MPSGIDSLNGKKQGLDLELFQIDIKTTFLNDNLKEEIHMNQSIGFVSKG